MTVIEFPVKKDFPERVCLAVPVKELAEFNRNFTITMSLEDMDAYQTLYLYKSLDDQGITHLSVKEYPQAFPTYTWKEWISETPQPMEGTKMSDLVEEVDDTGFIPPEGIRGDELISQTQTLLDMLGMTGINAKTDPAKVVIVNILMAQNSMIEDLQAEIQELREFI
jgi:hypothetical protein